METKPLDTKAFMHAEFADDYGAFVETVQLFASGLGGLMTEPEHDWPMMAHFVFEGHLVTVRLPEYFFGSGSRKDRLIASLALICRTEHVTKLALQLSTFTVEGVGDIEAFEQRRAEVNSLEEMEDAHEAVVLVALDAERAEMSVANIERHEDAPPDLTEWRAFTDGEAVISGRMIDLLREAMR